MLLLMQYMMYRNVKTENGGSKWKVFRESNDGLKWSADADEYGDFITDKHKGSVGMDISWSDLRILWKK